ncbi:hypothetical protein J4E93_009465, partial [Alternaria ventricosa]|uniref:uncharacterized protein n=1 Tax=Alternaria ventricosa TaxID=1187951 RepID=UPI0020C34F92
MKASTAAPSDTMNPTPVSSKPVAAIIPPLDPLHDLIPGYPMLAGRMGNMPEVAMFRRFGALNARSLLYYQAELAHLEDELQLLEAEDAKSKDGKKEKYTTNAFWLNTADFRPDGELRDGDKRQRDLIVHMRHILREYNDALIQQATILREMKKPDPFDLNHIQKFIAADSMNNDVFVGPDHNIWGSAEKPKDHSRELVVLRARKDTDSFSRVAGSKAMDWLLKLGADKWKKIDPRWGT